MLDSEPLGTVEVTETHHYLILKHQLTHCSLLQVSTRLEKRTMRKRGMNGDSIIYDSDGIINVLQNFGTRKTNIPLIY